MCVSQAWKGNLSQVKSIRDTRECCISHSVHETVELTDQGENSGVRHWRSGGQSRELRMPGVKLNEANGNSESKETMQLLIISLTLPFLILQLSQ